MTFLMADVHLLLSWPDALQIATNTNGGLPPLTIEVTEGPLSPLIARNEAALDYMPYHSLGDCQEDFPGLKGSMEMSLSFTSFSAR